MSFSTYVRQCKRCNLLFRTSVRGSTLCKKCTKSTKKSEFFVEYIVMDNELMAKWTLLDVDCAERRYQSGHIQMLCIVATHAGRGSMILSMEESSV